MLCQSYSIIWKQARVNECVDVVLVRSKLNVSEQINEKRSVIAMMKANFSAKAMTCFNTTTTPRHSLCGINDYNH